MKKLPRVAMVILGLLSLSSCALPPREAWRVIRNDGLFPYVAVEMGRRPVPTYVHLPSVHSPRLVTLTTGGPKEPRPVLASSVYVKRPACFLVGNAYVDTAPGMAATPTPKPSLAPVTPPVAMPPPPKPVPTVAAKPAPKPRPAPVEPMHVVAKEPATPKTPPVVAPSPKPAPSSSISAEIAAAPKAKPAPEPAGPEAKPKLPPNPTPVPNPNRVVEGKPATTELPFGSIIPGRPGLVNSPYAGKNQLVDVTGLEPGQEVKCPYSGRLFRVPGVKQAKSDVKTELEPPPAGKKKE